MRSLHSRKLRSTLSDSQHFYHDGVGGGMRIVDYLSDKDRSQIVEEVSIQLFDIARQYFPRTSNLEYAILKTHLIIEHALTQFIRCTSFVLVEPESLRYSFSQKLEIAILHGFGNGCSVSVPSVELLNKIRNQIAHRFVIDVHLINELILINSEDVNPAQLTDRQRIAYLRSWCYSICGGMAGWLKMMVIVYERPQSLTW
jgi:hypothetical protein